MIRWHESRSGEGLRRVDCGAVPHVLFLDRDGVVIQERHYLRDPDQVQLIAGAAAALRRARAAGFRLIGVSNQSGLGRGFCTEAEFQAVQRRVDDLLDAQGAGFDAFFYCPHGPDVACRCRKPRPGLLEEARAEIPWQAESSWLVGDKVADMELALDQGLGAILVRTGHGLAEESRLPAGWPVRVVADLACAVDVILAGDRA